MAGSRFLLGHTFGEFAGGLAKVLGIIVFAAMWHVIAFNMSGPPRIQIIVDEMITDGGASLDSRLLYLKGHADIAPEVGYAILIDGITLGMAREEVLLVCGFPDYVEQAQGPQTGEILVYYTGFGGEAYLIGIDDQDIVTGVYSPDHHNEPVEFALGAIE